MPNRKWVDEINKLKLKDKSSPELNLQYCWCWSSNVQPQFCQCIVVFPALLELEYWLIQELLSNRERKRKKTNSHLTDKKSWSGNPQIKRGHGFAHLSHIIFWKQVGKLKIYFLGKPNSNSQILFDLKSPAFLLKFGGKHSSMWPAGSFELKSWFAELEYNGLHWRSTWEFTAGPARCWWW